MRYVFFGTPDIAVASLKALCSAGLVPQLVVTQPDRPAGRGKVLTPPPVKVYALSQGIKVVQIEKVTQEFIDTLQREAWDCFVLVAFGMLLPQKLIDIPRMGVVNMHPSLLPKLRGPSPIRTALLTDVRESVGVTVMCLDAQMDHGPILAQRSLTDISSIDRSHLCVWPMYGKELDEVLAHAGGALLADTLPRYVRGEIHPKEQDHTLATYCKFIQKTDAEIDLRDNAHTNLLKICAYDGWPSAYTFVEKNGKQVRIKITKAHTENSSLVIDECVPEGKKPMPWGVFQKSL